MIRLRTSFLAAAAVAAFAGFGGGSAHAQSGLNDLQVAHSAYTADLIDIEYAKIALAKTKDASVRSFAELMIRDHTAVNEGAAALLAKLKVTAQDNPFSQALQTGATAKKAELNKLNGKDFDRAYAANELAYHQTVNKIVGEIWVPTVQNPEVKAFLAQALVTFRIHEDHANHMVGALK